METNIQPLNVLGKISSDTPLIKVVGVGGGGSNAANYMYLQQIPGISYLVINTDRQHNNTNAISHKICIGERSEGTHGLGAGCEPEKGREAILDDEKAVRRALSDETRMVFITACMGGGTGTGAAPEVARIARSMGLLTLAICTLPFAMEGPERMVTALRGVEDLKKHVDSILLIHNDDLPLINPDFSAPKCLDYSNEALCSAARSVAEIIATKGFINVDFADVRTFLSNSGSSVISQGFGTGERSVLDAIDMAINSPLFRHVKLRLATRIILFISYSSQSAPKGIMFEDLRTYMSQFINNYRFKMGQAIDDSLGDQVKVIVLAANFSEEENQRSEEDIALLNRYNITLDNNRQHTHRKPLLLTESELDDDSFIAQFVAPPLSRRSESELKAYRSSRVTIPLSQPPASTPSLPKQEVAAPVVNDSDMIIF